MTPKSPLNLRGLNERRAGANGFCSIRNGNLVLGDDTRARFWGIDAYRQMFMDETDVDAFVSAMAARGVNLIRIKGSLCDPVSKRFGTVDQASLKKLCYFVHACAKNGVYVALALYDPNDYVIASTGKPPYGLLYISKRFRALYKKWMASILLADNPYTRRKLCQDPAIVWFEIQSGGGFFSDTFTRIPEKYLGQLETSYTKWLLDQHGDADNTIREWNMPNKFHPVIKGDNIRDDKPLFRLFPPKSFSAKALSNPAKNHLNRRKGEQVKFLVQRCRKVNADLIGYLKRKCRFKGLVRVGNITVGAESLRPAAYLVASDGDLVAGDLFVKGPSKPDGALIERDRFRNRTVLTNPLASPMVYPRLKSKAFVATTNWLFPNKYRAEAVPFVSAYAALCGADVYIWNNADSPLWDGRLGRSSIQSPAILGAFPLYALMFRRGDIAEEKKTIISRRLSVKDILNLKGDGLNIAGAAEDRRLKPPLKFGPVNPLAAFVGKVEIAISGKGDTGFVSNTPLDEFLDEKTGVVSSATGQLALNYSIGVARINTPCAQGVVGIFGGKPIKLDNLSITVDNKFARVVAVALDGKPLAKSKRILVHAFSQESNSGWKEGRLRGKNIRVVESPGSAPVLIEKIHAKLAFLGKDSGGWNAWKLDVNGNRVGNIALKEGRLILEFPQDAMYVELTAK